MMPTRPPIHGAAQTAQRRRTYDKARQGDHAFYCTTGWLSVRKEALIRDLWQCQSCKAQVGQRKGDAHVDHIQSRDVRPDLSLDLSNLQTLCAPCHSTKTLKEIRGVANI